MGFADGRPQIPRNTLLGSPDPVTRHLAAERKKDFMGRQIDAHQRSFDQYD